MLGNLIIILVFGMVQTELAKLHVKNGLFVDQNGASYLLHGNAFNSIDTEKVSDEEMEVAHNQFGMTVARIPFMWHKLETAPGKWNQQYLDLIADTVRRFGSHGIYSILDMHQDMWAVQYCGHGIPDFYAYPENNSLYWRNGALTYPHPWVDPVYNTNATGHFPPIQNCDKLKTEPLGWISTYATFSVGSASQKMYDNVDGYLDKFGEMWQKVAEKVKNIPGLLGYELINEPWLGDALRKLRLWKPGVADSENLYPFHRKLHEHIRKVDNDTVVFFEPATGGNIIGYGPLNIPESPGGKDYNDRQALSYHIYCPLLEIDIISSGGFWRKLRKLLKKYTVPLCNVLNTAYDGLSAAASNASNVGYESPLLAFECATEGHFPKSTKNNDATQLDVERLQIGGMLTEFGSISSNDPMAVDAAVWLMNVMDFQLKSWSFWAIRIDTSSLNTVLQKMLARTYAQITAGHLDSMIFDSTTGYFEMHYQIRKPQHTNRTVIFTHFDLWYPKGLECQVDIRSIKCLPDKVNNRVIVEHSSQLGANRQVKIAIVAK